ncbi:MAG: hypothetical protein LBQ81_07440 [Zoogloeaceae bacterium]|jgi:predicted small lipoprotein YifL|nr:hypothetical protein [Zoogloeaceae bacterium]
MLKKSVLVVLAFLLSLAGCGQDESGALSRNQNEATVSADADSVRDSGDADEDDDDENEARGAPFSRSGAVAQMQEGCRTNNLYPTLTAAEGQQLCACFYDEAFGNLSDAEWAEWMREGKLRSELMKDVMKGKQPDAEAEARLERSNRKWGSIYAKSEKFCIQKLGLKVTPVHRED